jgi:hypothetical protein
MIRRFSAGPSDRRSNQTQQLLLLWPAAGRHKKGSDINIRGFPT